MSRDGLSAADLRWQEARGHVLPLLESPGFFEACDERVHAAGAAPLLRLEVVPDELALALVLPGEGRSMRFLSQADLERFARPLEALRAEAVANLQARVRGRLVIAVTHGVIARIDEAPWFRATLALLPDVRARLAEALGEVPVLALPARDDLVALAPRGRAAWQRALPRLRRSFEEAANPLSDRLFQATAGGLAAAGTL
jgi:hypothetical protein